MDETTNGSYPNQPSSTPRAASISHRCIGCGYDLTGSPREGVCPECGIPVAQSLQPDLIQYRLPAYVKRLNRGARLVRNAVGLMTGSVASLFIFQFAAMPIGFVSSTAATVFMLAISLLAFIASLASLVTYPIGWWLLTAPDPGRDADAAGQTSRRLVRLTLVITASATAIAFASIGGVTVANAAYGVGLNSIGAVLTYGVMFAALIAAAVQFYACMVYLRWFAQRLPNVDVYRRAKWMMWLGPLCLVCSCFAIPTLIALAIYYSLMYRVCKDLTRICLLQERSQYEQASIASRSEDANA